MSYASRGKYAESKVRDQLKILDRRADFAFARYPDAHAGSLKSAPADFEALCRGHCYKLEVKEVNHAYRLPRANFPVMQRNRMLKWKLAGASTPVLIYFKPANLWRFEDVSWFTGDETKSWDMTDVPGYASVADAMAAIFNT